MATLIAPSLRGVANEVIYPESDGKPMADSMIQAQWMTLILENLTDWYKDDPNVLVAIDLLWYPVEGKPEMTLAPDVMVVFGRPKFPRPSYKQWEENGVAPKVVFEIISGSNSIRELFDKTAFYERYGVEECYLYDPETGGLEVVQFTGDGMRFYPIEDEWISPLLGVRFVPQPRAPMELFLPNGKPFRTLNEERMALEYQTEQTRKERERADAAQAERDAERSARVRRDAKLRELGIDPDTL